MGNRGTAGEDLSSPCRGQAATRTGAEPGEVLLRRLGRYTGVMKLSRLAGCAGIAGPLLFTVAWVACSLRQAGHPAAGVQLSGLAAPDARDPQIMIAAFVVLGACSAGFGAALRTVAPRSGGPWLVVAG